MLRNLYTEAKVDCIIPKSIRNAQERRAKQVSIIHPIPYQFACQLKRLKANSLNARVRALTDEDINEMSKDKPWQPNLVNAAKADLYLEWYKKMVTSLSCVCPIVTYKAHLPYGYTPFFWKIKHVPFESKAKSQPTPLRKSKRPKKQLRRLTYNRLGENN